MNVDNAMSSVLDDLVQKYPELSACVSEIEGAFALLAATYLSGGKVLICGNGGSASDSDHIVGELMKGFMSKRRLSAEWRGKFKAVFPDEGDELANRLQGALPAISLVGQAALMTAYANDVAPEMIFAQQVFGYAKPGDALIGLSTSGNSANVIRALQVAKVKGAATIGLTGASGGQMAGLCDVTIRVPFVRTSDIQERHLPIYHALCIMLEKEFFDS